MIPMLQQALAPTRQPHPAEAPDTQAPWPATAAWLPEHGLPQDRHARIAARRCFVDIKQRFMAAVDLVDGPRGNWLRYQVRQAQEMTDLWLLRGAVFGALEAEGRTTERARHELQAALDDAFPNAGELLPYGVR